MSESKQKSVTPGPYRGIHPFRYADRKLFFGREDTISTLLVQVLLSRLVVLFGESGAGKSSLINAGLIPALEKEGLSAEKIRFRPIIEEPILVERIRKGDDSNPDFIPSLFQDDLTTMSDGSDVFAAYSIPRFEQQVRARCERNLVKGAARTVLIFDQFEELFTLFSPGHYEGEPHFKELQQDLAACLNRIVTDSELKVKAIIVIREDFLAKLDILAKTFPQVFDHRVRLGFFKKEEAVNAICGPFQGQNPFQSAIQRDLAEQISQDLLDDVSSFDGNPACPGVHPTQLQIICSRLWANYADSSAEIGKSQYEAAGGVKGILEGFLESELSGLSFKSHAAAVKILKALVTEVGTRDVVSQDRLRLVVKSDFSGVIEYLEARRLLYRNAQRDTLYYEIASEYLIPAIIKQAQFLEAQRKTDRTLAKAGAVLLIIILGLISLTVFSHLRANYEASRANKADSGRKQAETNAAWQLELRMQQERSLTSTTQGLIGALTTVQRSYDSVNAQLDTTEAELRKRNEDLNTAYGELKEQAKEANQQRLAFQAEALALKALRLRGDPRALVLARQAYLFNQRSGLPISDRVDEALRATLSTPAARVLSVPASPESQATIWAAAFNQEKKSIVAVARNGRVWSWSLGDLDKNPVVLLPPQKRVLSVALSPNGRFLASSTETGVIQLSDLNGSGQPVFLATNGVQAGFLSFDGSSRILLCGLRNRGTLLLWDLSDLNANPKRLETGSNSVTSAAYSARHEIITTADFLGEVQMWRSEDLESGFEPAPKGRRPSKSDFGWFIGGVVRPGAAGAPFMGPVKGVTAMAFSPNADQLALGSGEGRLWVANNVSAAHGQNAYQLEGPNGPLSYVSYDSSGKRLAASGWDGVIRVWELSQAESPPRLLVGHEGGVSCISFSPDGSKLVSSGVDQTVRFWDIENMERNPSSTLPSLRLPWHSTAFQAGTSVNGNTLAEGNWDGTVRVCQLEESTNVLKTIDLPPDDGPALSVGLNGKGDVIAIGTYRGDIPVYNVESTNCNLIADRHLEGPGLAVALTPDASILAAATLSGVIHVWSGLGYTNDLGILPGHESGVVALAIHPSGRFIASGSWDGTLRYWSLGASNRMRLLMEHKGVVSAVAFSSNGAWLASGALDGTIHLWKIAASPVSSSEFHAHEGRVLSLGFSADNQSLVSGGWDKTARIWNIATPIPNLTCSLHEHGKRVLAVALRANGRTLCSSTPDEILLDWVGPTAELAEQVCKKTNRNLTPEEWLQFIGPKIPYEATCVSDLRIGAFSRQ